MSDGSEFQVCGAATENARRANSVRVLAADSSGASETSCLLVFSYIRAEQSYVTSSRADTDQTHAHKPF